LSLREPDSFEWTVALLIMAALFYIPANLFPIMTTTVLGEPTGSTIIGGVVIFLQTGSYFVGFVIFTASILIPLVKMFALAWLCYCTKVEAKYSAKELTNMYRLVEFIGKWSMIDVFVVALLVALVQLTGVMTIQPGIALRAFALVVILTMLSAHKFDVRLLWDKMKDDK
jgi:paraquat-inducible protein A